MQFGNTHSDRDTLDPHNITHPQQLTAVTKFLGIHIQSNLKWENHCKFLSSKLSAINFLLLRLRKIINHESLKIAYFGLFQSLASYGIQFWGGENAVLHDLFLLQKRAIRIMYGLNHLDSCKPYFISENILTLPSLYILETSYFASIFLKPKTARHTHDTRNCSVIVPLAFRTHTIQINTEFMSSKIFNHLPENIKSINTPGKFKSALKEWLSHRGFSSTVEYLDASP